MRRFLWIVALCTACASMQNGRRETITAESEPPGADVAIVCSGQRVASGITPAKLTIPRMADHCEAVFAKERFATTSVGVERGFSRYFWADVIMTCALGLIPGTTFGGREDIARAAGVIGTIGAASWMYDRHTGAMYDHNPSTIHVQLRPSR